MRVEEACCGCGRGTDKVGRCMVYRGVWLVCSGMGMVLISVEMVGIKEIGRLAVVMIVDGDSSEGGCGSGRVVMVVMVGK